MATPPSLRVDELTEEKNEEKRKKGNGDVEEVGKISGGGERVDITWPLVCT